MRRWESRGQWSSRVVVSMRPIHLLILAIRTASIFGRVTAVAGFLDRASKEGVEVELLHTALALHANSQAAPAGPCKLKFGS
jgi:hypothetical protein